MQGISFAIVVVTRSWTISPFDRNSEICDLRMRDDKSTNDQRWTATIGKLWDLRREEIVYFRIFTGICSKLSLARSLKYFFSVAVARNGRIFCPLEGRIPMMRRRQRRRRRRPFESSRRTDLIDIAPARRLLIRNKFRSCAARFMKSHRPADCPSF